MPQGQTRKQHTVSEFYLAGFADQRGRLAVRMRNGHEGLSAIAKATVHNEFYTYYTDDGERNQDIEDWFATEIEAPVAKILRRLRAGDQPSIDDVPSIARFVTTSMLRTATVRSYMEQIDERIGPLILLSHAATRADINLLDKTPDELELLRSVARHALDNLPHDQRDRVRGRLRTLLRKSDDIAQTLTTWTWRCEHASEPAFITADAPVATLDALQDGGWHGIVPPGSPVFMPISPTHLLVGDPAPLANTPLATSFELVEMVNTTLAKSAHLAVFKSPHMPWPPTLRLPRTPPTLPAPNITMQPSPPGQRPTFPVEYDPIIDPAVDALLRALGANDTVE